MNTIKDTKPNMVDPKITPISRSDVIYKGNDKVLHKGITGILFVGLNLFSSPVTQAKGIVVHSDNRKH